MKWVLLLLPLLSLAACGSTDNARKAQPEDQTLARHEQAGNIASSLDRPTEAIAQYEAALKQAEARDDLTQITKLSFSLAVAQLRANRPADAVATATRAAAEIKRRGGAPFPALTLAEATAHYRMGNSAKADEMASELEASAPSEIADGASFLRGVIADERNDDAGLRAALGRIADRKAPVQRADWRELEARLALRHDQFSAARSAALEAAAIRQTILDYRGMARALYVAALAAERAGDSQGAADLYLRAGRSAAAQGDTTTARPWLEQALRLTHNSDVTEAAQSALDRLGEPQPL